MSEFFNHFWNEPITGRQAVMWFLFLFPAYQLVIGIGNAVLGINRHGNR